MDPNHSQYIDSYFADTSVEPEVLLRSAQAKDDDQLVRDIFTEYIATLEFDASFQDIEQELADLNSYYALSNDGIILLAFVQEALAGCVALRPFPDSEYINACEMKRLYVRPIFRGFGLGRQLTEVLIDYAKAIGYQAILLDTMDEQETARELYHSLGFKEIPPYHYSPLSGSHYLKLDLP